MVNTYNDHGGHELTMEATHYSIQVTSYSKGPTFWEVRKACRGSNWPHSLTSTIIDARQERSKKMGLQHKGLTTMTKFGEDILQSIFSIADALELRLSCTNLSTWSDDDWILWHHIVLLGHNELTLEMPFFSDRKLGPHQINRLSFDVLPYYSAKPPVRSCLNIKTIFPC